MGKISSYEAMALRWSQLCNDPLLANVPGKIEVNRLGVIEMSPASTRHGMLQFAVGRALDIALPAGTVITECAIATSEGVRVPDVAWCSPEFVARHGEATPLPAAPEICVEVRSPSNFDDEMAFRIALFLAAGAVEVWIVNHDGSVEFHDQSGRVAASRFGVPLDLPPPLPA